MDVYGYLPDVISYSSSMRHPFGAQQNSWSMETPKEQRTRLATQKVEKKASCDDCPICQERRRRPLATYIRSKSRQDRCASTSISEDSEEACEEPAPQRPPQQTADKK